MLSIGFCDDEASAREQFRSLMEKYRSQCSREIRCTSFHSPLDLLAEIERGARFDVLFLDVLMPGENGIHAAMEIRQKDSAVKIIFLTNSAEFAVQSYTVGAFYYQMKPLREDSFFCLLDSVLAVCQRENVGSLLLRCKTGITRIEPRQMEYCEIIHRTLFIHLTDGRILESNGSMEELYDQLVPFGGFFRPHRSFLVNFARVESISFRAIIMSGGARIPIPRGKYNEIKKAFLDHAFQNGQVIV